ncbi:uncharacterized protein [Haliotis cracherodii]|uniref:uncharacterized protein n=1 Tax=Haliotis cracherodii TaxID=6455 RepID=UPI0039E95F9F
MFRFLLVVTLVTVVTVCFDDEGWMEADDGDDIGLADMLNEEDIQAVLKKYDIDDNGELSVEELDLGRAEISAVVNRKQKEQRQDGGDTTDRADEEPEKPDGAVLEEKEKSTTSYILLSLIGGGVVLVLAVGVMKRQQTAAFTPMSPETQRLHMRKREDWLDKISSQNVAHKQQENVNNSKQSTPLSTKNAKSKAQKSKPDLVHSDEKQTIQHSEHTVTLNPELQTDQNIEKSENKSDQLKSGVQTDQRASVSSQSKTKVCSTPTDTAQTSDQSQHNQGERLGGKQDRANDLQVAGDDWKEDLCTEGQTAQAQKAQAMRGLSTSNKSNLRQFLSNVLDSTIDLSTTRKTRYSLGSLTINAKDVPEKPDGIPAFLAEIMKKIVPRQISRIKYVVKCYSSCEEFQSHFNDQLVTAACEWLKQYSVGVIMDNLKSESANAEDDDLWSDYGNTHVASEAVKFLLCVTGWSEDSVQVPASLLSRLLQQSEDAVGAAKGDNSVLFLTVLLQAAGQQLSNVDRMDEVILREGKTLRALEILLDNGTAGAVLAIALEKEVTEAAQGLGNYFEKSSLFGPLLAVSTVPTKFQQKRQITLTGNAASPFTSMRGFPRVTEADLHLVESAIQEGLHRCWNVVYNALMKVVTSRASREQGLSWIASVINLNELRTSALLQNDSQVQACCTDAYMMNFCGMLLEFFLPIYSDKAKLDKINLGYSTSEACRLNYDFETCLAGGQIVSDKSQEREVGTVPEDLQSQHNFITECFHLNQRALSVGVLPTITHYNRMQRDLQLKMEAVKGSNLEEEVRNQHVLLTLMWDACLCDQELVRSVTMFYLCQAQLLQNLLKVAGEGSCKEEEKVKAQKKAFAMIPEFCVKDMAIWFRFVATHAVHVHKGILQGLSISTFVDCCVSLLERPDLMPGPIPASKMVSCLLQFVNSSKRQSSRGWGSGLMSDLAAMVETCPSVQNQLGPALLRTYVSVDVVEGLDVDKDEFDKYSARSEIGKLIEHLWRRADCRTSIVQQCEKEIFQNFLGAILDTLLYMLHDSLSRLANIKKIEVAKQNEPEWNALSLQEKKDKEHFLKNEEHVGKGFMAMANQTLEFIDLLTRAEEVARCFTRQPLAKRAASVICGFLESLCGSKAKDYKVKDFEKYNFSPQQLLLQITTILLRIAREVSASKDNFLVNMATDAEFDASNLDKALSVISSKGLAEEDSLQQFQHLIHQLRQLHEETRSDEVVASDELSVVKELDGVAVDQDQVLEVYTRCMTGCRFLTADIQESHSYLSNLQSLDPRSPKVKVLMKEMKQLQQNLPVHPNAAIFVVQEEERIDVMRALVTGPVGTPYSLGCFVFDIYFPASYPNSAPLVKIITTGGGSVRFNPNLYSDGKVCLSLLGTWHGGDASEKWNPAKSSIYQVLVSIQSLILIPDPMFNEPGYEGMKGKAEGDRQSTAYNWKIRLNTLRHAVLGQLRNPPPGLEKVIRQHFAVQKDCVLRQCRDWLAECQDEDQAKRLRQLVTAIYAQLQQLQVEEDEEKDAD